MKKIAKNARWVRDGSVIINGNDLPIYKRDKAKKEDLYNDLSKTEAQLSESMVQLQKILNKYVELVSSGDCGFWNPEEETDVRECRAFINRVLGSE